MKTHVSILTGSLAALLLTFAAIAQDKAAVQGTPSQASGTVATVNGKPIPQSRLDLLVRERVAQGQQDTPELRSFLKQELINREIIQQEAVRRGLDKNPEVVMQLDMVRQGVLVAAFLQDYLRKNQPTDTALKSEYDRIKAQQGEKEYRARHILVKSEDEAKDALAQLAKGAKFETIATEKSIDTGSKGNGGDLNWAPPGRYVKPFADALTKLKKGETTKTPVQTQFGWHVIQLQDERPMKIPTFDEAKSRLVQMMSQQALQKVVADLRSKAKVTE
ncbi:MAG: peptidylprolyl isomerase [Betaproteobacteria bacterium]|nr:MAG: peptidylprolyl isomerase [Betaproteobacteria bacterium]